MPNPNPSPNPNPKPNPNSNLTLTLTLTQNGAAVCSLEEVRGVAAAAEKAGPCKADFAAVAFPK